jgi:predicted esterase
VTLCAFLWPSRLGLLLLATVAASGAEIPKGHVLEKVACTADNEQTYALYVPTAFDPARKWPVLFCFDPGARGKAPVERFQAAAEKYGWLVAGSNNSRNGPWDANAKAINAMITDVNRHLPIDSRRVYVTGLSGGARVACQLALGGIARGVIACSAGFPTPEIPSKLPFVFFGTAGVTDFNYRELRRVDRELDDRRAIHRVVFFGGGHEWLPAELAVEALAWLELQAMRDGTKPKDAAWIEAQFESRRAAIPAQPAHENYRGLKALAADFKSLADTAALEKKVAELAKTREVADALKADRAAERREQSLSDELMSAVSEGFAGSVKKRVDELRAKAAAPEDSPERQMMARVLQGVASSCNEGAREAMREQDYVQAVAFLEMATLLRPERPQAWFDLARARAHLRDKKAVVAALQQAVAAGFKDAERVRMEKAFDYLRNDPAFVALVGAIK